MSGSTDQNQPVPSQGTSLLPSPAGWVRCEVCDGDYPRGHAKLAHPQPGPFGWRDRRIVHKAVSRMYVLGIISGYAKTGCYHTPTGWRLCWVRFRGKRPYMLGFKRAEWGHPWHRVKHGHWPNNVGLGLCGTCAPWPCCGATGLDHADGCEG